MWEARPSWRMIGRDQIDTVSRRRTGELTSETADFGLAGSCVT